MIDSHNGRGAAPRRQRRRAAGATVAALAMVGVTALGGCGRDDDATPTDVGAAPSATAPTETAGGNASARPPAVYKEVATPCAVVVTTALEQLVGPAGKKFQERSKPSMQCQLNVGAQAKAGLLDMDMTIAEFAEAQYHGLRGIEEKQSTVTDLPGLGQSAYSYVDTMTGPHVVVLDGNLYLTVRWVPLDRAMSLPEADVIKALTEVAGQTMSKLQAA
jgi:hypothetical protein